VSVTWGVFNHLDLQTLSYNSRASSTCTQCLTVLKPREAKANNQKTFALVFVFLILAAVYTGRFTEQLKQYTERLSFWATGIMKIQLRFTHIVCIHIVYYISCFTQCTNKLFSIKKTLNLIFGGHNDKAKQFSIWNRMLMHVWVVWSFCVNICSLVINSKKTGLCMNGHFCFL
jgi:hypothetical protein